MRERNGMREKRRGKKRMEGAGAWKERNKREERKEREERSLPSVYQV